MDEQENDPSVDSSRARCPESVVLVRCEALVEAARRGQAGPGRPSPNREAAPATMGKKSRKRAPSLVSPTTQRELETLKGSMRAQTARHLAE